ncbi:GNAT family N-acetyltransferase [Rhodocytophaga rosea]|uniref:GNAT family N-acetyltransferase n=1 Tax=Rhodocytophaga rosea TaxID=2704465 RepID=A0A6C0GTN5_9BACT|nr:GNAT family N-acetyltransferase [Rhodocytophaga rosea]QHT70792.1 GNAT family N-acetyltransferase [Rhodocytophaga rosea]
MKLLPIELEEAQNQHFTTTAECVRVLTIFSEHYKKVGFTKPWIAYFVSDDTNAIIGGGGYKGKPNDNQVEISYGTFKNYQGRGVGTEICRRLVELALQTDPLVKITARTLPDNYASITILKRNGFTCLGTVLDPEDGDVLEWEYNKYSA